MKKSYALMACAAVLASSPRSEMLAGEADTSAKSGPAGVPISAGEVRPLLIGAPVPSLMLRSADGKPFDLKQATAKEPTVLIFYRGGWCPYCNRQLGQLQTVDPQLRQLGYRILAISPDRPEKLNQTIDKTKPSYTLLSDHAMKAASAFGIAFRVDDATLTKYKGYGIDLEDASGEAHHLLPVPSVFIVGKDGRIGFTYVNPDYRARIDPDVLLSAARATLKVKPGRPGRRGRR